MSKTAETATKSTATAAQHEPSFLSKKEAGASFWGESARAEAVPFFQPKLTVNAPNDRFEKEADAVADRAVQRMAEPSSPIEKAASADAQRSPISNIQRAAETDLAEKAPENELEKAAPETEGLQRKPIFESAGDDGENIQRNGGDGGETTAPEGFGSQLSASKGGGSPLPTSTASSMGEAMGADFSGVRVHTGSSAAAMSDQIGAQAFAHGSDVYFNAGKYDPESAGGQRLLAHELAHTVQQGGAEVAKKDEPEEKIKKVSINNSSTEVANQIKKANAELKGDFLGKLVKGARGVELHLDKFSGKKYVKESDITWIKKPIELIKEDRATQQRVVWKDKVEAGVRTLMEKVAGPAKGQMLTLRLKKGKGKGVAGTFDQLVEDAIVPFWDGEGKENLMDIEHLIDHQIMGGAADDIRNLMLLDRPENRSAGQLIKNNLKKQIDGLLEHYRKYFTNLPRSSKTAVSNILVFIDDFDFEGKDIDANKWFDEKEMIDESLSPINKDHIEIVDFVIPDGHFMLKNSSERASIFLPYKNIDKQEIGGWYLTLRVDEKKKEVLSIALKAKKKDKNGVFKKGREGEESLSDTDTSSFKKHEKPHVYELHQDYLKRSFGAMRQQLAIEKLSPIEWQEPDFDTFDVAATGQVLPTISLLKGADIKIMLNNGDFVIRGEIALAKFAENFPKPFKIDALDLIVEASSQKGLMVGGGIDFSLGNFGSGSLSATVGKSVEMAGIFNFTNKYFDPAQVNFKYANGKWSIGGKLGIPEGKIKGVKSATLAVSYGSDGAFMASGKAFLTVPGISAIDISAQADEKGNFQFQAEALLAELPGIKSGTAKIIITSKEGGDIRLGAAGKAVPNLPSVPQLGAEMSFFYDDGLFEIKADVDYKNGRVGGKLSVGVTNRPVDEKGNPIGDPKTDGKTAIFGFGQLKVDLLKGNKGDATLGVRLTPAGDVLVSGELSLRQIRPFGDGKQFHKDLPPQINIKIPLIGVPGLSVYLAIGGGPYFDFKWDPLVLKELTVTFPETKIDELDKATLGIRGSVGSMARAEAGVFIKASLGAQVLVANLEGSLIGSAGLALEAEAGGDIAADFSLEKGLVMKEINAKLAITPKAVISLKGQFRIYLDLWVTTVDLYSKTWTLAEGAADLSGFSLNASFPIRFDEKGDVKPPESPDDMTIEQPDFGGKDGENILDSITNGDAKREKEAKKQEIRRQIRIDMRQSVNGKDFSPSVYSKKLVSKYKGDAEMTQFITESVEDESRLLEYEEFDALKIRLRGMPMSVPSKMAAIQIFKLFRHRIQPADVELFHAQLLQDEREKERAIQQAAAAAALAAAEKQQKQLASKPKSVKNNPKTADKKAAAVQTSTANTIQRTPAEKPKPAPAKTDDHEPTVIDMQAIVQAKFSKLQIDPAQVAQFADVFKLLKKAEKEDQKAAEALRNLNQGLSQEHASKAAFWRSEAEGKKRIRLEAKNVLADDILFPTDRTEISHREKVFRQGLFTRLLAAQFSLRLTTFSTGKLAGIELFWGDRSYPTDGGQVTFDIILRGSQTLALDFESLLLGEIIAVNNEMLQILRNLGEPLFLSGKKLGETFGHVWNSNVYFGTDLGPFGGHFEDHQGWSEVFKIIQNKPGAKAVVRSPQGFLHVFTVAPNLNTFDLGSPFGDDYGYLLARGIATPFDSVEDVYVNPNNFLLEKGAFSEGAGWRTEYDMNKVEQFAVGAFFGDYFEDGNGTMVFGQIVGSLIPVAGQLADGRDVTAGIQKMWQTGGKDGKLQTALALVGFVPLIGDGLKAQFKVGKKVGKTAAQMGDEFLQKEAQRIAKAISEKIARDPETVAAALKLTEKEAKIALESLEQKLARSLDEGGQVADEFAAEFEKLATTIDGNFGQVLSAFGGSWKNAAKAISKSSKAADLGNAMKKWRADQFARIEREVAEAVPDMRFASDAASTPKMQATGTADFLSDFDVSFIGPSASLHKNLAEEILAERFGSGWKKILDADLFTDPKRMHAFIGLEPKMARAIERKMVGESELNFLARMLQQGKSLDEVAELAKQMKVDVKKVVAREQELKALAEGSRDRLRAELEMDLLERQMANAASPAQKAAIAERMTIQQGKLNAALADGPYFTPGGVAQHVTLREPGLRAAAGMTSLSPSMAYMSVLDDFTMLQETLLKLEKEGATESVTKSFAKYAERLMRTAGQNGVDFSQKSTRKTWDDLTDLLALRRAKIGKAQAHFADQKAFDAFAERISRQADDLFEAGKGELLENLRAFLKTTQANSKTWLKTASAADRTAFEKTIRALEKSILTIARAEVRQSDDDPFSPVP